jgi:FAD/FMN-containing dehydrogenase
MRDIDKNAHAIQLDDHLLSNVVFEGVNRVVTRRPSLAPRINQVSARALSRREYTDASYRVFCTRREVRFTESEFAVPRDSLVPVLRELRAWVDRSGEHLPFPVEVRFAAADDSWLSTGYERDNAYVAVHQYHRMDGRRYFAAFEAIVREHAGRPHWGKLHTHSADELRALYPRFDDFVALRDRLDPDRVLSNDHLDRVLGA